MAAGQRAFRISKSIAGAAFLLLGMFILYANLAAAVARSSHVLAHSAEALGVVPALVLAASQAVHACAFNHQRFFQQMLASSWPLLLVIFGTVLSKDTFADNSKHTYQKNKRKRPRLGRGLKTCVT